MNTFLDLLKRTISWLITIINSKCGKIMILLTYVGILMFMEIYGNIPLELKLLMLVITLILSLLKAKKSDEQLIGSVVYSANTLVLIYSAICGDESFGFLILVYFALFESFGSLIESFEKNDTDSKEH